MSAGTVSKDVYKGRSVTGSVQSGRLESKHLLKLFTVLLKMEQMELETTDHCQDGGFLFASFLCLFLPS